MTGRDILLLAGLIAFVPGGASAQDSLVPATLDSGTLVRVHPVSGADYRGRLLAPLAPSSDVIALCRGRGARCTDPGDSASMRQIPTASVSRIEVARGTQSATGAAVGGAFGLAFGVLAGAATGACVGGDCGGPSAEAIMAGSIVMFALIGALVGAGIPAWGPPP